MIRQLALRFMFVVNRQTAEWRFTNFGKEICERVFRFRLFLSSFLWIQICLIPSKVTDSGILNFAIATIYLISHFFFFWLLLMVGWQGGWRMKVVRCRKASGDTRHCSVPFWKVNSHRKQYGFHRSTDAISIPLRISFSFIIISSSTLCNRNTCTSHQPPFNSLLLSFVHLFFYNFCFGFFIAVRVLGVHELTRSLKRVKININTCDDELGAVPLQFTAAKYRWPVANTSKHHQHLPQCTRHTSVYSQYIIAVTLAPIH